MMATDFIEYDWEGPPHRALSDALACLAVWQWCDQEEKKYGIPSDGPKGVHAVAEALKADWETGPDLGPALYISTEYCCSNI